ncbi:hypothetical protein [Gimesia sp.]|uniref:hypothetical protein n=1 Tax=Gimesia sp. TaxID=2024833 RepID=UPI003A918ED4
MATIAYSSSEQSWVGTLDTPLFNGTSVFVDTSGSESPPSPTQLRAVEAAESLPAEFHHTIDRLLRDWVASEWEQDLQEDLEPEDFEWEVYSVEVPHIKLIADSYFLIHLQCELEAEHGIGIACRSGQAFAVCHPDSYSNLKADDDASLNAPFSAKPRAG